ncbi:unnamed protein product [Paramecium pentaurelia]|uniref:PAS domain-containing protein n=1 Tax=Paramecium pentaurelia TaxID=43138 RepID=A0A8S1TJ73_9CILI|nr:unnamed protein product [Paramecium pentaurelia]
MDLQSNFSKRVSDRNGFQLYVDRAKNLIFTVTSQLLHEDQQPLTTSCLAIIIQYFQLTYLMFNSKIQNIWKNQPVSDAISYFLSCFLLSPYTNSSNYSSLIILLYLCIGIFTLSTMLTFFIGLGLNKKKQENNWIKKGLKILINLFLSILYLPIIDVFISIIDCGFDENGVYVHNQFQDQECWVDTHILHGIVAIIFSILFYCYCVCFSMLYFESKYIPTDPNSKMSGRPLIVLFTYELIQTTFQKLVDGNDNQYFQIILLLGGSLIIFQKFHTELPYNQKIIQKFWSITVTLNVWGTLLLCCSMFLEKVIFSGIIYAFISGLPLLILTVFKMDKLNFELLLINHSKVSDVQEIINQTNYLIKLLHFIKTDSDAQIIIDGYLEIHRVTCVREDCYLKIKNQPNIRLTNSLLRDSTLTERETDLIFVLGQIYYNQIKRFPESVTLRIRYSFLLSDYMRQLQQAFNELTQAEQLSPSFDEEFIILRKKFIIQEQLDSFQNENFGKVDVASEISFQNNYRQLLQYIEQTTLSQMEFWSILQEDFPDLAKVYLIGQKINKLLNLIDQLWIKIQKASSNISKAMRLYGQFINDVLQDEDYGEQLLKKSELYQQQIQQRKKQIIQFIGGDEIGFEQQATVIVSTSIEKFALVITLNQSCCHLIGYTKQEIINRKINLFMPNLFQKFHDQYIERFLLTSDIKNINKDRFIFLKDKQNYILPCYIVLRILHTIDENVNLAAQFITVKAFKPSCYLIVDQEYIIDSISATAIQLLGIENKYITNKKIRLDLLFPEFIENLSIYMTKFGGKIKYEQENFVNQFQLLNQNIVEKEQEFICIVREIINITTNEVMGFYIKLELCEQGNQNSKELLLPQKQVQQNLQFKYIVNQKLYLGEFVDENNSKLSQSILWDQVDQSSLGSSNQINNETTHQESNRRRTIRLSDHDKPIINYAENIRVLRLFQNQIQEIDDKDNDISEDEEKESVFQVQQDLNPLNDQEQIENNIFRSRKNLESIITSNVTPRVIVKVKWISNIIILIILTLSFIDYFITINQTDEIFNTILLVKDGNFRNSELGIILSSIFNLQLLNRNVFNLTADQAKIYELEQRSNINDSINYVNILNQEIVSKASSLTQSNYEFEFGLKNVQMQINIDGQFEYYDLNQAIQQILSKSLSIRDKKLNLINQQDSDVNFVIRNWLNGLQLYLKESSNNLIDNLISKTMEKISIFVVLLAVSISTINIGLFLLIIALISVSRSQSEIVSLFLDIPDKTIRYLYHKSENFLTNLQIGEDDDLMSENDENIDKEENAQLQKTLKSKRTKKKYKNANKEYRYFIYIIIFILILIQGYFILTYFISGASIENIHTLSIEFNLTARTEQFYRFVEICQRSLFYSRNMSILEKDSYDSVVENQDELYSHNSYMQQLHSLNIDLLQPNYVDAFNSLYIEDPCKIVIEQDQSIDAQSCSLAMDSGFSQGLNVGVPRFFENARYLKTIYDQFYDNPKANFTLLARGFATFRNITKDNDNSTNFILNLNNFLHGKENREIQHHYFKNAFRYLTNQFIEGLNNELGNLKLQRLAIFILFEVLLFVIYFLLWLPLALKMAKDIWSTRAMILMIPLKIILRIRSIKDYIRNQIQEGDQDS